MIFPQLLDRLNKVNISLASGTKSTFIESFGVDNLAHITESLKKGKQGKINSDNLNYTLNPELQRVDNKMQMENMMLSDYTVDRLDCSGLSTRIRTCPLTPSNSLSFF